MFASMFQSLFKKSNKNLKIDKSVSESVLVEITTQDVEDMLTELNEIKHNSNKDTDNHCSASQDVAEAFEVLSIADTNPESFNDDLVGYTDDTTSEVSSVGENNQDYVKVTEDVAATKIVNQINNLLCPFTWTLKPNKNKNLILLIQNKFGDYNLNISSPEFSFERYIGNLIISYELFHKNETESAQMKILEIGKWLEELDNGTDEFYLSINNGLQYVIKATFIHMLYASNLIEECKWLLDDIESFANMNCQSRATVYAIRAAVLTEYGGNAKYFTKACEYAKKACVTDPTISHWFYIYSLALTAQRHHLYSYKSSPTDNEINGIQQAILLSDGKNTSYNYHRMTLDRDIAIRNYHQSTNKNDKDMIEKNLRDNKTIVQMIKTIVSMEPKDPLLVVKCAKILMTLPVNVRDFNLGKQYLTKAFQMASNDVTVLKAIEKTVEIYKEVSNKNHKHRTIKQKTKQNQRPFMNKPSKLGEDIRNIVKKHNNGEDAVPYLTVLVANYNGKNKWKIMAQICSYTILFKNNLRASIEQFIPLIEQPGMSTDHLITKHYSSFGSKNFNLAELICNEIRLATNSSNTSSEDMLFYYKMLTKIMEICNVNVKEVDSFMKEKLIVNVSYKTTNTTHQSETKFSMVDESLIDKTKKSKFTSKNYRPKRMQNSGNVFTERSELNKAANKMNFNYNNGFTTSTQEKGQWTNNASDVDQLKLKMSKFFPNTNNTNSNDEFKFSNNSNPQLPNLRNVHTQAEIENYTQLLYQPTISGAQQQNNSQNVFPHRFDRYNKDHSNTNSSFSHNSLQNAQLPSLLSLKPTWPPSMQYQPKKK